MPIFDNALTMTSAGRWLRVNEASHSEVISEDGYTTVMWVSQSINDHYYELNHNDQDIRVSNSWVYTEESSSFVDVNETLLGKKVLCYYANNAVWDTITDVTKVTGSFTGSTLVTNDGGGVFIGQHTIAFDCPAILVTEKTT